jgi:hypothetical protein
MATDNAVKPLLPPPVPRRRHRANGPPSGPVELISLPRVGRLDTVKAWSIEVGRLYRAMRRGDVPVDLGARMAYVAKIGAELVQAREELENLEALRQQVEAVGAQQSNGYARVDYSTPHDAASAASGCESLPEHQHDSEGST